MDGGKLLFFEVFLMNLDSNIWQTVINSSIFVMALSPTCSFCPISKFMSSKNG
jgi:hypothetical protein